MCVLGLSCFLFVSVVNSKQMSLMWLHPGQLEVVIDAAKACAFCKLFFPFAPLGPFCIAEMDCTSGLPWCPEAVRFVS